jgi:cobalt-precorrin-5B (C1)-methyltransferase
MKRVVFVGMIGKLTKLASGVLMTHYTRSSVDIGLLAGIDPAAAGANTARHAFEMWQAGGLLRPAGDELCARVGEVLRRFTKGALEVEVAMVDFTGLRVVAATRSEWVSCGA